ncbi:SHOCT domain-containing protein [Enterococcus faecium]|uniref:SHOCT domain-containing protein n=1 Tax=Enterococcus faecium TaxID=1352 RepID=UPI000CF309AF|nr:SHOCT domain-containing protein [Enterococcus faecium]EGP5214552.1 SHOCT domain-containing protein [Enterococcus faecium]EME8234696.1 SHOCT domain-containing protein [Enterococcus faecium]MBE8822441.1 SHOCT domain-containing protein [Enterococcus faecium]MBE8844551.1 SHOCT domain-containing protein [Enterococcus faecium]PQG46292.1 SHOCT domain-containing protein [Enterococcus faecium]
MIIEDFYFDDIHKKAFIKKSILKNREQCVFNYNDLISYTPIFEGSKIKKHHGITRAVVGGVLAGPIGALVGAGTGGKEFESVKQLGVMVHLADNSSVKYLIINSETKLDSIVGRASMDIYNKLVAKLEWIVKEKEGVPTNTSESQADEIRKYKELLDDGIITEEEFNKKKQELLEI